MITEATAAIIVKKLKEPENIVYSTGRQVFSWGKLEEHVGILIEAQSNQSKTTAKNSKITRLRRNIFIIFL
jgi:hypothetical protein